MDKLLILDIDETLVHATQEYLGRECDFETDLYFVYKRPYLEDFLTYCFLNFKVAVWTSAGEQFADDIAKAVINKFGTLEFIWSNERCTSRFNPETFESVATKNLDKVKKKGYSLDKVIMIDDTPEKLLRHYGNLVRVKEYTGQLNDNELKILIKYLESLKNVPSIRKVEKRGWQRSYG